ncbi:MAG: hypothetical protein NE328_10645 [Lentisphaeraceae bacterium]|nr:hypothetical protein [Lentisphaeraceae bacterium]
MMYKASILIFFSFTFGSYLHGIEDYTFRGNKFPILSMEEVQRLIGFVILKSKNKDISVPKLKNVSIDNYKRIMMYTGKNSIRPSENESFYALDIAVKVEENRLKRFMFQFTISPSIPPSGNAKTVQELFNGRTIKQFNVWTQKFGELYSKQILLKTNKKTVE